MSITNDHSFKPPLTEENRLRHPSAAEADTDPVYETLTQAYQIMENVRKPYPAEIGIILSMFVSPEHIERFADHALYLKFIRTLVDNRENVAFPDTREPFVQYFSDCLRLKEEMLSDGASLEKEWLDCCIRLLENLKTPYYPVYSHVLSCLRACFPDTVLFEQTLQAFYTVLIRSGEDALRIIGLIAEHGRLCHEKGWLGGPLLSDLLIHQLSIYTDEKRLYVQELADFVPGDFFRNDAELLSAWFEIENLYYNERIKSQGAVKADSLAELLSSMSRWIRRGRLQNELPEASMGADSITGSDKAAGPAADLTGSLHSWSAASSKKKVDSAFLNTFAYNMNLRSFVTNPAIGREQELRDLELILLSPKKSPILIGDAGVGKTSVVEGLSWLLQKGDVPELLKDKTLFKLTTTSLLSGTKYVGEMEDRIKQLTAELAKYPDVILFIDEIHTIVGAGSTESSHNDISNMLKPFIDRGDIKIIGATTTQEYEAYMLPDRALARRFYPIAIEEPDEALARKILIGTIPAMEHETRVRNPFDEEKTREIIKALVRLSRKENQPPGRLTRLPELPLSLLEMAFSYAALYSRKELSIEDLVLAVKHTNLLSKDVREKADYFIQV